MNILFIIDPLPSLSAYKDTSVAMMQALQDRGHHICVALQSQLYLEGERVRARVLPITIKRDADLHGQDWWQEGEPQTLALADLHAVVMRKDPPFDLEYLYSTHLLDRAQAEGARVFNTGAAIRNHPEKLAIAEFPEFTTPTLVTSDMDRLKAFHEAHGDVVVKPLDGMGGSGVFRMQPGEVNRGTILEMLTDHGRATIMAQRYIPEIRDGDKRVIIIDGKPVPHVLARIPLAGETRGNLAAGGTGVAQPLNDHDRAVAEAIGARLAPRGLMLIGLDMIGPYVTEINVTSPTCFVEITQQTGFDVPGHFAEALLAAIS